MQTLFVRVRRLRLLAIILLVFGFIISLPAQAYLIVIGNKASGVRHLTKYQLKQIYKGQPVSLSGEVSLTPFDRTQYSEIFDEFYRDLMRWSPSQFNQFWANQVFRGDAQAPTQIASGRKVIAAVRTYRHSIGYVDSQEMSASDWRALRVLYQFGGPKNRVVAKKVVKKKPVVVKKKPVVVKKKPVVVKKKLVVVKKKPVVMKKKPVVVKKKTVVVKKKPVVAVKNKIVKQKQNNKKNTVMKSVVKDQQKVDHKVQAVNNVKAVKSKKSFVQKDNSDSLYSELINKLEDNSVKKDAPKKDASEKVAVKQIAKPKLTVSKKQPPKPAHSLSPVELSNSERLQAQEEINAINNQLANYRVQKGVADYVGASKKGALASTADGSSLWPVLLKNNNFSEYYKKPSVKQYISYYLRHKQSLQRAINHSKPFLAYVYQQTELRRMPAAFALLPFVESNYVSKAYSRAGAVGLWQMMPVTASAIGVNIDWWYDGRRDIVVSTQAALDHLQALHAYFDNWLLSAAAYNCGTTPVARAQAYNRGRKLATNFWAIRQHLPRETAAYVPKLIALTYILQHASQNGLTLPAISTKPAFRSVLMSHQIDFSEAAKLSGVSVTQLKALNPGLRRWATEPNTAYHFLVPDSHYKRFMDGLKMVSGKTHLSWQYHEINSRDTLSSIARNYRTNAALMKRVNNLRGDSIKGVDGLLVPLKLNNRYRKVVPGLQAEQTLIQPSAVIVPDDNADAADSSDEAQASAEQSQPAQSEQHSDQNLKDVLSKIYQ